ncbi:nucleic acid-binding proteins superfamily [Citrus sinensis]|uniref:Nucleic acid-binding proteins superfamily n=1 Tax=Citrus sinensis TaxID=2711 RepID=A0ACB8I9T8_CITSI|nr:nucleic acid-binding proteins superfamily [Citrus sinensis]
MEIDNAQNQQQEEEDPFLGLIEYARSVLWPGEEEEGRDESGQDPNNTGSKSRGPGWGWIASRILKTCIAYSSGVTVAILLSDLAQAWNEQHRVGAPKKRPEIVNQLKKHHRRTRLPNTVTIDSIYEKNFLSLTSVLETVVVDVYLLPGTNIYMLTLGDFWSSNTIDLYLHRRYYELVDPQNGILKKGREVFLTGCYLRTAREGCGSPRLLPTEYLVILLDEGQDHDAILLDFYSDSFSSISLDAFNNGVSYSFNARIESIGLLETQGEFDSIQRRQITLVDNDGVKMKFLLWGEQVLIANLFSIGSTLALDRPYIALETSDECCLEYGTATQLYLVPFIQQEEQVCVPLTQNRYQGSRLLSAVDPSQVPIVSQVTLPCDSQGSIDFSNYPFRPFIINLCDKMTGLSLYGVVIDIFHKENTPGVYSLKIEDTTGVITVKLHFADSWSLGRLGPGHVHLIKQLFNSFDSLEVLWSEKDAGASFVNLSCLPALLNSSCLHSAELVRTFHLKVTLADESTKVLAWCTGQTAIELLQISPNEFYELPEEEQIMYPSSLEGERFLVALVNCKRGHYESSDGITQETQAISWEITRALKWE